jgi:hypothetical protein
VPAEEDADRDPGRREVNLSPWCLAAVASFSMTTACSRTPRLPTEGEVRDLLLAREKGLQKIGADLVAELAKAKVPTKLPECGDNPAATPGSDATCDVALARRNASIAAYEAAVTPRLPQMVDSVEAYGLAVRLIKKDVAVSTVILPPCTRQTSMSQHYLEIREYSVSWGNAFVTDDGSEHSNIMLQYKVPYEDAELRIIACFLTDGTERKR